uniref:Bestrophin homolog n=1 Tax=Caenorhabditis japonica TaxID=281687 RepID=A0A8R1DXR0_CAEJA
MRPWIPIEWALECLRTAHRRFLIDAFHYVDINDSVLNYRQQLHEILCHDSITVPLVYVQAVHICTLCYFLITCFASQTIHDDQKGWMGVIDFYLPVYSVIEFIVFVGWLKTAFVMLNPFGMDDDDFEMNVMIERNLMVSLSYINDFYDKPPKLVDMKQTVVRENANPMHGSAVPVKVNKVHQAMLKDPQIANLVSSVLPNGNQSVTELVTHRPINEIADFDVKNMKIKEYHTDKFIQNPNNSTREEHGTGETAKTYLWKQEELEAAVAKLMDKRLAEEKISMLSPESTQKSSLSEDPTQKSWVDSTKVDSVVQPMKKQSRLKPRVTSSMSKQNIDRTSHVSTRKVPKQPSPGTVLPSSKNRDSSLKCDVTQEDDN